MSAIIAALEKLRDTVEQLETRIAEKEAAAAEDALRVPARRQRTPQEDLFAPQVAAGVAVRDNAMIGERLDGAIDSLEKLLATA